jgi:CubicO group peptidase (beta-lactamase class C family)
MTRRLFGRMSRPTTMAFIAAIAWIILLSVTPAAAQDPVSARVDEYVTGEMKTQRIPGVSVAVIKAGQVILAKGYGLAHVEHQVPVKPETIFQSGSVGKQFTATAVMMLVEAGKVGLDDRISKYLIDAPESWKRSRCDIC